jgi:cytochrome P450
MALDPVTTLRSRPSSPRTPPATGVLDLMRLVGGLLAEAVRHPREFSARTAFRTWARGTAARHRSNNLIVNFGVKRVLLVGAADLSAHILDARPTSDGFAAGAMKRKGMSFLAPHALTISDDEAWERRRVFNEGVLEAGRPHEFDAQFLASVLAAFEPPIIDGNGIRSAMGRAMLEIVLGPNAPRWLADDAHALFGLVQRPVERAFVGPWARRRRARFYAALRDLWRDPEAGRGPTLLAVARRSATSMDETELVEQIPHWMFTFTASGTDLVTRTLALVTADAEARRRALRELHDAGPIENPRTIDGLAYIEACVVETAHLFPPVTRTFHRAPVGAVAGDVVVPAGMELVHTFPLLSEGNDEVPRRFRPERWLAGGEVASGFDPFLGGARHCPGRSLIVFVCKAALAVLLARQELELDDTELRTDALPWDFPKRGLKFRRAIPIEAR